MDTSLWSLTTLAKDPSMLGEAGAAKFLRFALRLENRLTQYAKKIAKQKTTPASSHAFDSCQIIASA